MIEPRSRHRTPWLASLALALLCCAGPVGARELPARVRGLFGRGEASQPLFRGELRPLMGRLQKVRRHDAGIGLPDTLADIPFALQRYRLQRDPTAPRPLHGTFHWHYEVRLGRLRQDQFARLCRVYNSGSLQYDPRRNYSLSDFLPPTLRQMVGRQMQREWQTLDLGGMPVGNRDGRVLLESNCHATAYTSAWSFSRPRGKRAPGARPPLYFVDRLEMGPVVEGPTMTTVRTIEHRLFDPRTSPEERNRGLRPGDIVQFYNPHVDRTAATMGHDNGLLHSMVWLGPDLYFHQPNTNQPWVITSWKLALSQVRSIPGKRGWRDVSVVVRRPQPGKRGMPHPSRVFSVSRRNGELLAGVAQSDPARARRLGQQLVPCHARNILGTRLQTFVDGTRW